MTDPPAWKIDALCAYVDDPTMFFAEPGTLESAAAKDICYDCTARVPCFEFGRFEPDGIWGGFDELERADMNVVLGISPPRPPCTICGLSMEDENRPKATRHEKCAAKVQRDRKIREAAAVPGRCQKCGVEMSYRISKCGACTWSPKSGENPLPY